MLCLHKSRTMIPFALLISMILGCLISAQVSAFQNQYCDPVTGVCQPVQTFRPATFQPSYRTPTVQPVTTFASLDYSALSSAPVKRLNYDVLEFDVSFDGGDSEKIKVDEPFEVDGRKFVIKEIAKPVAVSSSVPTYSMPATYATPIVSSFGNCPNCPDCNPQAFSSFGNYSTFESPSTLTLSSRPGFATNRIMTSSNGAVYRFAPIRTAIRNFFSRF